MSRFDYVQYDAAALKDQFDFKAKFKEIDDMVDKLLINGRAKSLVFTKLEEAYMWVGKAVRDDQIRRNGTAPLQEQRGNGVA